MRSYKPEVTADSTGKWYSNGLRFATFGEADIYVQGLALRWTAVRDTRVIESDDEATHDLINGKLIKIEEPVDGNR